MASRGKVKRDVMVVTLDGSGNGTNRYQNNNSAAQYDIGQISARTSSVMNGAVATVFWTGLFVGAMYFVGAAAVGTTTVAGDSMSGPPDIFLDPDDYVDVTVAGGPANGTCTVIFFYEENVS